MSDKELEAITKLLVATIFIFLGPLIFVWIWNANFSDWYVFTYWRAFWLAVALKFLGV